MENQSLCRPTRRLLGRRPTKNTNRGREKTAGKNNNEEEGARKGGRRLLGAQKKKERGRRNVFLKKFINF